MNFQILCFIELIIIIFLLIKSKKDIIRIKERTSGIVRKRYLEKHKGFMDEFYLCAYCFKVIKKENMRVDHIKPFAHGGSNNLNNLCASCSKCNGIKKDKKGIWIVRGHLGKLVQDNIIIILFLFIILMSFTLAKIITIF